MYFFMLRSSVLLTFASSKHACNDVTFCSRSLIPKDITRELCAAIAKLEDVPESDLEQDEEDSPPPVKKSRPSFGDDDDFAPEEEQPKSSRSRKAPARKPVVKKEVIDLIDLTEDSDGDGDVGNDESTTLYDDKTNDFGFGDLGEFDFIGFE